MASNANHDCCREIHSYGRCLRSQSIPPPSKMHAPVTRKYAAQQKAHSSLSSLQLAAVGLHQDSAAQETRFEPADARRIRDGQKCVRMLSEARRRRRRTLFESRDEVDGSTIRIDLSTNPILYRKSRQSGNSRRACLSKNLPLASLLPGDKEQQVQPETILGHHLVNGASGETRGCCYCCGPRR